MANQLNMSYCVEVHGVAEADATSNGSNARSFFIRASGLGAAKLCGFLVVDASSVRTLGVREREPYGLKLQSCVTITAVRNPKQSAKHLRPCGNLLLWYASH